MEGDIHNEKEFHEFIKQFNFNENISCREFQELFNLALKSKGIDYKFSFGIDECEDFDECELINKIKRLNQDEIRKLSILLLNCIDKNKLIIKNNILKIELLYKILDAALDSCREVFNIDNKQATELVKVLVIKVIDIIKENKLFD